MSQDLSTKIKIRINRIEYRFRRIKQEAWPVNWSKFKQPEIILQAVMDSTYRIKVTVISLFLATIVSFGLLIYSFYLSITVAVAAQGGELREAVVGGEMNIFNPVFDPRSTAESKIVSLIYLPLYEVQYPDFISNEPNSPVIEPILLAKPPEWINLPADKPEDHFKKLRFTLKENIKWSDGSSISLADIEYTINRLKENRGNSVFKDTLVNLTFEKVSNTEFVLHSATSNPQLIYLLNFRPIPQSYFDFEDNDGLFTDSRSRRPVVTSGYFRFPAGQVQNPNTTNTNLVDNPVRDSSGKNVTVVLEKNPISNTGKSIFIDKYILTRYDSLTEVSGENQTSLERAVQTGSVDLYTRFLGSNIDTNFNSAKIKELLGLEQKVIPSNTYYTAYFNTAPGYRASYVGFLVNQSLRKYIACHLLNYQPDSDYSTFIDPIVREKRLVPLHFNQNYNLDCGNLDGILDPNFYSIQIDERTRIKKVLLDGEEIRLTMLGVNDTKNLLIDLQIYFRDKIGVPVELVTDATEVNKRLDSGEYNVAVLPIKMVISDPKPLYSSAGRNLSGINLNNRVENYKVDSLLDKYSSSQLQDQESKNALIDFFVKEFVSVNLYRARQEYNFSVKAGGFGQNLPDISTFADDIYFRVDSWYVNTSREAFWNVGDKIRVD